MKKSNRRMCSVKHNSKLDKDFDSPCMGCHVKLYAYWVYNLCLGFVTDDINHIDYFYYCKHHSKKMPTHRHVKKV